MVKEDHEEKNPQRSSNSQVREDMTEIQIKTMFDMDQSFDRDKFKRAHDEWISQNPTFKFPSKIINSKNITFSKFISDQDIMPFLHLRTLQCYFQRRLLVSGNKKT